MMTSIALSEEASPVVSAIYLAQDEARLSVVLCGSISMKLNRWKAYIFLQFCKDAVECCACSTSNGDRAPGRTAGMRLLSHRTSQVYAL